jgi:hypothetical protein
MEIPTLHTVPRPALTVERSRAVVEVDDEHERRITLTFSPLQALRVHTADLFTEPLGREVVEVTDSGWVRELTETLARLSPHATFMARARHWIVPGGDEVIEVVAWELEVSRP